MTKVTLLGDIKKEIADKQHDLSKAVNKMNAVGTQVELSQQYEYALSALSALSALNTSRICTFGMEE